MSIVVSLVSPIFTKPTSNTSANMGESIAKKKFETKFFCLKWYYFKQLNHQSQTTMSQRKIIISLRRASLFCATAEGGQEHRSVLKKIIAKMQNDMDRMKKDFHDLKRFRAKEELDRKREAVSMGMEDVRIPDAPPAPPAPPARPPRGTRRPVRRRASPDRPRCDCRVGAGTAQYRLKAPAEQCKVKSTHTVAGPDGLIMNICNRHQKAADNALEKYAGWKPEMGHVYGWWDREDWSKTVKLVVKPDFVGAKRKPRRKNKPKPEAEPKPTPEEYQRPAEVDEEFNPDRYDEREFDDEDE